MLHTLRAQTFALQDLESQFLQNNLQLIANKYQIQQAEALIVQEKVWPNPTFSLNDVNFWANRSFETMPNLIGNFGSRQQFAMDLEQLIETAGKRKKRVVLKELERDAKQIEFEELLRQLKLDLRSTFHSLGRIQLAEKELKSIQQLFSQLNDQFKVQADKQHVSQVSYIRVHTELSGIQKEMVDLLQEKNEKLQALRVLTGNLFLQLDQIDFNASNDIINQHVPLDLRELVKEHNLSLKLLKNDIKKSEQQLRLEKAERTPNINLLMSYERGGGVMSDFVGFGASMDLPIFNRNKGNIRAAEIQQQEAQAHLRSKELAIDLDIDRLFIQLGLTKQHLLDWQNGDNSQTDRVLENYIKYLQEKQVTLLEFIDFAQAYRTAQQAYFELQENYLNTFEELQYLLGEDIK